MEFNKEIANTLIGTENIIWDKYFNGQNLPKLAGETVTVKDGNGIINDKTVSFNLSRQYISCAYLIVPRWAKIISVHLYSGQLLIDTIQTQYLSTLRDIYNLPIKNDITNNGWKIQLPFDQLLGCNYLKTRDSRIEVNFEDTCDNCVLEYNYYDELQDCVLPEYFWYASNIYSGGMAIDGSNYASVDLNFTHPIHCIYFDFPDIDTTVSRATVMVNDNIFCAFDNVHKNSAGVFLLPMHLGCNVHDYNLKKVPLNASQAESIKLLIQFSKPEFPTKVNVGALVYNNMITRASFGNYALNSVTTGSNKVAIGYKALMDK